MDEYGTTYVNGLESLYYEKPRSLETTYVNGPDSIRDVKFKVVLPEAEPRLITYQDR